MTIHELIKICQKHIELGLENVPLVLKMTRKSKRRINSKLVRTPFGLCRWHRHSDTELAIYVSLDQIHKFIINRLK
jgi:hypothetical protein